MRLKKNLFFNNFLSCSMGTRSWNYPEPIKFAENLAKKNFNVITLDVRETQIRAIEIYEKNGYIKFGVNPFYATVSKKFVKGYYYYKQL